MREKNSICLKVYLKPELFSEMAAEAEKSGHRRKGLPLFTQKPHGFGHEKLANTDGVARYLKHTHSFYVQALAERLRKAAEIESRLVENAREKVELEESRKKLGTTPSG